MILNKRFLIPALGGEHCNGSVVIGPGSTAKADERLEHPDLGSGLQRVGPGWAEGRRRKHVPVPQCCSNVFARRGRVPALLFL